MRKEKKWLKEEIKVFQEGENMFTAEFNAGVQDALEYAQELIDQLDEPETLSQEWIDENKVARIDNLRKMTTSDVVPVEKLKNLIVPKQEKQEVEENFYTFDNAKKWLQDNGFVVFEKDKLDAEVQRMVDETYEATNEKSVIPKFVADWIDAYNLYGNNPLREYIDLESDFIEGWTDEKDAAVYHWVNKNPYAFIDALRYGYEVEKEKLYTVDLPHSYELIKLLHTQTYRIKKYSESGFGDYTNTFTEAEIKKIDERLMAFAEEVTPCN